MNISQTELDEKSLITKMASKTVNDRISKREEFDKVEGSDYWYDANFNPFGKNIGDCGIRAISAALMMRYEIVCKMLGYRFKNGMGMERKSGITLDRLAKSPLMKYFEQPNHDYRNLTVGEFTFMASCELDKQGLYVVNVQHPDDAKQGHMVYVCAMPDDMFFIDTFDSSDYKVRCALKVKRQIGKNNPARLRYKQFKAIQEVWRRAKAENLDFIIDDFISDAIANIDGNKSVDYDLKERFDEWLAADNAEWIWQIMRKGSAEKTAVQADALKNMSLLEKAQAVAADLNGDSHAYGLKIYEWFGRSYAEEDEMLYKDQTDQTVTVYIELKIKRDMIDTPEWELAKKRIFGAIKDAGLARNITDITYHQELGKHGHGVVWIQFIDKPKS